MNFIICPERLVISQVSVTVQATFFVLSGSQQILPKSSKGGRITDRFKCSRTGNQTLRQQKGMEIARVFQNWNNWESFYLFVLSAPSVLGLGIYPKGCASAPINNCFFVCYNPVGLVTTNLLVLRTRSSKELSVRQQPQNLGHQMCIQAPSREILVIWSVLK